MMLQRSMTSIGHLNPTVHVPPWSPFDPTAGMDYGGGDVGALDEAALAALRICLTRDKAAEDDADVPLVDAYASDAFRMYEFKVRPCARGRNHDWTECPFAHPGEKARRRDPLRHRYSGSPCPAFRKAGGCKRGDACEFAHGVFECWLHPDRYRTQPCKDGTACRRRVCFFAHTPEQLRVVTPRSMAGAPVDTAVDLYDGSLVRRLKSLVSSPTSTLNSPPKSPPIESPPISPSKWQAGTPVNDIVASLRQLQLGSNSIAGSCGFASPRGASSGFNAAFRSLPSTPTAAATGCLNEAAERVESGRALRARMFEKLSKDAKWEKPEASVPDVTWVSDLLK